jgi:Domain of unknown function (DUF4286)
MLLFNVTVIMEDSIANDWLQWMRADHIPQIMATDCFVSNRLLKILDSPNEGVTYCAQYIAEDIGSYQTFKDNYEQIFTAGMYNEFPNKLVSFSSLMEFIA